MRRGVLSRLIGVAVLATGACLARLHLSIVSVIQEFTVSDSAISPLISSEAHVVKMSSSNCNNTSSISCSKTCNVAKRSHWLLSMDSASTIFLAS